MTGSWLDGFFGSSTAGGGLVATGNSLAVSPDGTTIDIVAGKVALDPTFASQLQNPISVNVKAAPYNAKGDGSTDDLAALNQAEAVVGAAGGGEIFFPPGTYIVSDQFVVAHNNVTLRGVAGSVIKAKDSTSFQAVVRFDSCTGCRLIDLDVDANKATREATTSIAAMAVFFNLCTDFDAIGVTVRNSVGHGGVSGVGMTLTGTRGRAIACKAINCGTVSNPSDGFFLSGTELLDVACISDNCEDTGHVLEDCNFSGIIGSVSKSCGAVGGITNAVNADSVGNFIQGLTGYDWDATTVGAVQIGTLSGTGRLLNTTVSGLIMTNVSGTGPAILVRAAGGACKGLQLIGADVDGAGQQALVISDGVTDMTVDGGTFRASQTAIALGVGCLNIRLLGANLFPGGNVYAGVTMDINCTGEITNCRVDGSSVVPYGFKNATGCSFRYSGNSAVNVTIAETLETVAFVRPFVEMAGAQTVAGAKTWSNAAVFSSTVQATGPLGVNGAIPTHSQVKAYAATNAGGYCLQATSGTAAFLYDETGNYGFDDYDLNSGNGRRISTLTKISIGTNTNAAYGSSTFTPSVEIGALNGGTNMLALLNGTAPTSILAAGLFYSVSGSVHCLGQGGKYSTVVPSGVASTAAPKVSGSGQTVNVQTATLAAFDLSATTFSGAAWDNCVIYAEGTIVGRNTSTGAGGTQKIARGFKRVSGTITAIDGSSVVLGAMAADAGVSGATYALSFTGNSIILQATGIAANTINWVGTLDMEITAV